MKNWKNSILSAFLMLILIVFILIIWIVFTYIGNHYSNSNADAQDYFRLVIQGVVIFFIYPFFSKILLSRWFSRKVNLMDIPKLKKTDWTFFSFLQLIGIIGLLYFFLIHQLHIDIRLFFIKYFSANWRGIEHFPVLALFFLIPFIVLSSLYFLVSKYMYGTFDEPKFENNSKDKNFRQKRKIYFAFTISTSIISGFLYLLSQL